MNKLTVKSFVEIKGFYNECYIVYQTEKAIKVENENGSLYGWIPKSTILNIENVKVGTGEAFEIEKIIDDQELKKLFGAEELKDIIIDGKKYLSYKQGGKWYIGKGKFKKEINF